MTSFGNMDDGTQIAGFEAFYEDDQTDDSIPQMQKITRANNLLPLWGDKGTMNINHLVLQNIVSSPYYKDTLREVDNFQQLMNEIYYNVTHLEPWERGTRKLTGMTGMCGQVRGVGAGGIVSSAFCLLYKLFAFKISRKQLVAMLNYEECTFIRGLGFMFIRYCQPPTDLWSWYEPYLNDEEQFDPKAGGGDLMTIGQMVKTLLTKLDWYDTLFPRIPVPVQKGIEANFQELRRTTNQAEQKQRDWHRANNNNDDGNSNGAADRDRDRRRERSRSHERMSAARGGRNDSRDRTRRRNHERGTKCEHHKKHHHCIKHKLKCPQKATKNKKPKEENNKKTDDTLSKSNERDTRRNSRGRSRSPQSKRARRSRSRSRDRQRRDRR